MLKKLSCRLCVAVDECEGLVIDSSFVKRATNTIFTYCSCYSSKVRSVGLPAFPIFYKCFLFFAQKILMSITAAFLSLRYTECGNESGNYEYTIRK
jgi:hypothetical protein